MTNVTDSTDPTEPSDLADAIAPSPTDADLVEIAAEATLSAGDLLAAEFRTGRVPGEYGTDDVKTEIDVTAENRVLDVLDERVPDHATHGEEHGREGDSDHVWVIDPLDGTNNFAADFPSFATAVCCVREDDPVAAAVYEPLPDTLYLATADGDARVLDGAGLPAGESVDFEREEDGSLAVGDALAADSDTALAHGTVSYVVGLPAVRDGELVERAEAIEHALEDGCKRVLQTWSPCVDWGLLARGGTEAVVCFHPDPYEQYPGTLLAERAGAATRQADGVYVAAARDDVADRLFEVVEATG